MRTLIRTTIGMSALGAVCAAVALAATAPVATTQPATGVSATTATLNAQVGPNGTPTSYLFQYGTSTDYGTQTPAQGPVKGNATKSVSADVTGLHPSTTYHYRVVATSSAGTVDGQDATLATPAPGAPTGDAVSITAAPKAATFGRPVVLSGAATGPSASGVTLALEQNPAPYTGGYKATGQTTTASSSGAYTFTVTPALNTRFRVVAQAKKRPTSPELTVDVRVKVVLHVSTTTPRRGRRVAFTGSVFPAHDATIARLQRRTSAGWRTVATMPLAAATPVAGVSRSKFAKRLKVRRSGTYRVRVLPTDGDHVAGTSRRRRLSVH